MLTGVVFALAFLAPVLVAVGLALWYRYIVRDDSAGVLISGVALGLLGGVVMGGAISGLLIAAALLLAHARH